MQLFWTEFYTAASYFESIFEFNAAFSNLLQPFFILGKDGHKGCNMEKAAWKLHFTLSVSVCNVLFSTHYMVATSKLALICFCVIIV